MRIRENSSSHPTLHAADTQSVCVSRFPTRARAIENNDSLFRYLHVLWSALLTQARSNAFADHIFHVRAR